MTSLGKDCYCATLHYQILDPPVIGSQNLQQTTDEGNTTTNDINMNGGNLLSTTGNISTTGGSVITNTIEPATGTMTTFKNEYRGDLEVQTVSVAGLIDDAFIRGDCVRIRVGLGSGTWVLPRGDAGNHFWFINSSGNSQRLQASNSGGVLDGLVAPNFISLSGAPYAIKLLCVRTNEWYSSHS